jgi:hypothetical protein
MGSIEFSPQIYQSTQFLDKLSRSKSKTKIRQLLKNSTATQLLSIAEICLNIASSRFGLTTRQKKRILPYADFVRRMSRARSEKGARKLAIQKGSGVGGLFAAILTPILIELARYVGGKLIKGKNSESIKSENTNGE